jgi:Domain of Unknown Function (DUF1206)
VSRDTAAPGESEAHAGHGPAAAGSWIEGLGRSGYAAKGLVYLIVGGLAVRAALGAGGVATDQRGALAHVAGAPFGRSVLMMLAIGLLGYALWQVVRATLDTDRKGADGEGLLSRAVYGSVSFVYVGLASSALQIAMGAATGPGSTEMAQDWTARLLGQPLGAWLVGSIGAAFGANGVHQCYRAIASDLTDDLDLAEIGADRRRWVTRIGRAGYAARGVAFILIGGFLVAAAIHANPGEARGLDGALATLAGQPFGPYLLGTVAAGLAAYGLFALVEARYRRMVVCCPSPAGPRPTLHSGRTPWTVCSRGWRAGPADLRPRPRRPGPIRDRS